MKIVFENNKKFDINNLREKDKSVSTLLIPAHLVDGLNSKRLEHGKQMSVYLRNLLKMYKSLTHSGMVPNPRKIKTEYQEDNLDLKKVSLRPSNADWIELGELALVYGKSRCWMFVFLLELDLAGFSDTLYEIDFVNVLVPTDSALILRVSFELKRPQEDFSRTYHARI